MAVGETGLTPGTQGFAIEGYDGGSGDPAIEAALDAMGADTWPKYMARTLGPDWQIQLKEGAARLKAWVRRRG